MRCSTSSRRNSRPCSTPRSRPSARPASASARGRPDATATGREGEPPRHHAPGRGKTASATRSISSLSRQEPIASCSRPVLPAWRSSRRTRRSQGQARHQIESQRGGGNGQRPGQPAQNRQAPAPSYVAINTNKMAYPIRDVLFFRVLVLDRYSLKPPSQPVMVHVKLLNPKDEIVRQWLSPTGDGGVGGGRVAAMERFAASLACAYVDASWPVRRGRQSRCKWHRSVWKSSATCTCRIFNWTTSTIQRAMFSAECFLAEGEAGRRPRKRRAA